MANEGWRSPTIIVGILGLIVAAGVAISLRVHGCWRDRPRLEFPPPPPPAPSPPVLQEHRESPRSAPVLTEDRESPAPVLRERREAPAARRDVEELTPAPRGKRWEPARAGTPTVVLVRNPGGMSVLIMQVRLHDGRWVKTPTRPGGIGAITVLPIPLTAKDFVDDKQGFVFTVEKHVETGARGWTALEISLVWPDRVGQTYIGRLTVAYDKGEIPADYEVEVDALAQPPKSTHMIPNNRD